MRDIVYLFPRQNRLSSKGKHSTSIIGTVNFYWLILVLKKYRGPKREPKLTTGFELGEPKLTTGFELVGLLNGYYVRSP